MQRRRVKDAPPDEVIMPPLELLSRTSQSCSSTVPPLAVRVPPANIALEAVSDWEPALMVQLLLPSAGSIHTGNSSVPSITRLPELTLMVFPDAIRTVVLDAIVNVDPDAISRLSLTTIMPLLESHVVLVDIVPLSLMEFVFRTIVRSRESRTLPSLSTVSTVTSVTSSPSTRSVPFVAVDHVP